MQTNPKMPYVNLGRSGIKVSRFSYGNWWVGSEESEEEQQFANKMIKTAFDAGVNFFDTAEVYNQGRAERQVGKALKALNVPRSDYVVATKIFWGKHPENTNTANNLGTSRKRLFEGVERSLKNLQLDYVDVLFAHRYDDETPTIEVVRAFKDLIAQGKTFYWGTSTWPAVRVMEAILLCKIEGCPKPIAEQCEYSMIVRDKVEKRYVEVFDDYGLGSTVWSPLASGILTGKYNDGIPKDSRFDKAPEFKWIYDSFLAGDKREKLVAKLRKLGEVAKKLECTQAQLALAWVLKSKDATTVIFGASRIEQFNENLKALDVLEKLTPEVLEEIETILDNRPDRGTEYRAGKPFPPRR